jgi:hypothetical protein
VQEHPDFDSYRYLISDFSEAMCAVDNPEAEDMITALRIGSSFSNKNLRLAYVCPDHAMAATVDKFLTVHSIPFHYKIFSTLPDARKWVESNTTS